jgi:hypothetical protein
MIWYAIALSALGKAMPLSRSSCSCDMDEVERATRILYVERG